MSDNIQELLQALKNTISDEWYIAVDKLTAMGTEKLSVYLQILQSPPFDDDPHDLIRGNIANILGELGDQRAFEPLIDAAGSQSEFLQERAIRALGKLRDKRAIGLLVAHLQNHWNPDMREEAAWALANYPEPWVIRFLVRSFSDKHPIVRDAAISALIQIGEAARDEITKAASNPDEFVRNQALETLAELDKKTSEEED